MTRRAVIGRAVIIAVVFFALNGAVVGIWAAKQREHLDTIGIADALEIAEFAYERAADDLDSPGAHAALLAVVAALEIQGAAVLGPDGKPLVVAGLVEPAALIAAAPGREHVMVGKTLVVAAAVPRSSLRGVAFLDGAPQAARWSSIRRRALLVVALAALFAPLFGFLGARLIEARR